MLSDWILWQNRDPDYVRDMLLHRIRALARRLETSPAQIYRILDQTKYDKFIDQVVRLIIALGGEVDFTITARKPFVASAPTP